LAPIRIPSRSITRPHTGASGKPAAYHLQQSRGDSLDELLPAAWHRTDRYANNRIEADHGRLNARLRPMRGLKRDRSARVIIAGHTLLQNVRRGHYELAVEALATRRVAVTFGELAAAI
jgi:transposase-like protein